MIIICKLNQVYEKAPQNDHCVTFIVIVDGWMQNSHFIPYSRA